MNNLFGINLQPLINEIKEFKTNQLSNQQRIIALLEEQNQLLKQLLLK